MRNAINGLFSKGHFDICVVRDLAALLELSDKTPAFRALRPLHCVDYAGMDRELRDRLPYLVGEALTPAPLLAATETVLKVMEAAQQ